jgi:hypothetical protein
MAIKKTDGQKPDTQTLLEKLNEFRDKLREIKKKVNESKELFDSNKFDDKKS